MNLQNKLNLLFRSNKRDAYITRNSDNKRATTATVAPANIRNTVISQDASIFKRIAMINQKFYSYFVSHSQRNIVSFLIILVLISLVSCKKDKGLLSLEWQNESLSLTAEICSKYRECADIEWKSIPENLKKFTEGRLDEAQCQKRFRESNAYKLIGADPLAIQATYKECHSQVLKFSCKDLQEGKLEVVPSCVAFQKIQNGN